MSRKTVWIVVPALLTLACAAAQAQTPASTAFSYQGQLKLNNVPLNNTADFIFKLFDAADGGTQIGTDLTVANVSVSKGLFAVQPDFGASAFAGDARWLDIQVRSPAGSGTFTPLSPRQELTPTPYSSCAAKAAPNAITNTMLTKDPASLAKVSGDTLFSDPSHAWAGINVQEQQWPDSFFDLKAFVDGWGGMNIWTTGAEARPYYGYHTAGYWAQHYLDGATGDWHVSTTGAPAALTVTQGGNVGIGTTDPWDALHVAGGIRVGAMTDGPLDSPGYGDTLSFSGGPDVSTSYNSDNSDPLWIARYNIADNSTELRVNVGDDLGQAQDKFVVGVSSPDWHPLLSVGADGNVGIGTTDPVTKLHVNGWSRVGGNVVGGGGANGDFMEFEPSGTDHMNVRFDQGFLSFWNPNATNGGEIMRLTRDGNVGIGTNNPQYKLDVSATARFSSSIWHGAYGVSTAYNGYGLYGAANSGSVAAGVCGSSSSGIGVYGVSEGVNGEGVRGECHNGAAAKGIYGISNTGYGGCFVANGANGIGVYGEGNSSSSAVGVYGKSTSGYAGYFQGRVSVTGHLGVGTSAGVFPLTFPDTLGDKISVWGQAGYSYGIGMGQSELQVHTGWSNNHISFGWGSNADFHEVMRVEGDGRVGIGTTEPSPQSALTVKGNIELQSVTTGAVVMQLGEGLDYSEGFDVSDADRAAPGTVLVIDPEHPGKLAPSTAAYDSKVAGIAAGAKGLGSAVRVAADRFNCSVALAGRVYCDVDATYGAIQPGDLLTTSPTAGHAMKVTDHARAQGAILGKAMERLEDGRGQILVLVTLQ